MLKQRFITATAILAVLALALAFSPPLVFMVLMLAIGVVAAFEWNKMLMPQGNFSSVVIAILVVAACVGLYFLRSYGILINLIATLVWLLLTIFLFQPIPTSINPWFGRFVIIAVIAFAVFSISDLFSINANGAYWVAGMFVLAGVADSVAYLTGNRFGKTRLAPHISPGKTKEGLIGSLLAVWGLALASGAWIWNSSFKMLVSWALICLLCALASVVGDLFISLQKRVSGVKDSGTLLPGHGGLLDRIDSTLAIAPVYALCVKTLMI